MTHRFFEGEIYHKRFFPKEHSFTYDYFFIDIDVNDLKSLNTRFFSQKGLGVMSFLARDHFGQNDDFLENTHTLITSLGWGKPCQLRFLTLPRIFNFVFNPISILLLLDENGKATHGIAEVHNYNGGRVLYPMTLQQDEHGDFRASVPKSMYVSPFMGYEGTYTFSLHYTAEHFGLKVHLSNDTQKMLLADFQGEARPFSTATIRTLLCNHTFLSLFVVTRTLWQTFRLKLKGLTWTSPRPQDQLKKELQ